MQITIPRPDRFRTGSTGQVTSDYSIRQESALSFGFGVESDVLWNATRSCPAFVHRTFSVAYEI